MPIETKLHAPTFRKEWVERDDLVRNLAGTANRLVLVSAPAGSGKTTVVAQWRSSPAEARAFAWVSLDAGDNYPARCWWHIVHALQRACPELDAGDILVALRVQAPDIAGTFLPLLVNGLAKLEKPVVLVLDGYHLISDRGFHDQIASLLPRLPHAVQLAVITRTEPPLPLARLRAAGELTEIRARELHFGPAQVAELVANVAGIELSEPDLTDLTSRPESGSSSRGPRSWTGFAHRCATPSPARPTLPSSSTFLSGTISSSCRLIRPGSGSGITAFSLSCSAATLPGPSRRSCPLCTGARAAGYADRACRTRPSAMRRPPVTSPRSSASSPETGTPTFIAAGSRRFAAG